MKSGELQRKDAEKIVQSLAERGRESTERIAALVQREVASQISAMGSRFEVLETQVGALTAQILGASTKSPGGSTEPAENIATGDPKPKPTDQRAPAKKSTAKKSAANKSTAKRPAAKKVSEKKPAVTKTAATKRAAKKPTPAKPVGSSGVRKVSAPRKT